MEKTLQIIEIVVAIVIGITTIVVMTGPNEMNLPDIIQNNNQTVIVKVQDQPQPVMIKPTAIISGPDEIYTDTEITFVGDKSKDPNGFVDKQYWYVKG